MVDIFDDQVWLSAERAVRALWEYWLENDAYSVGVVVRSDGGGRRRGDYGVIETQLLFIADRTRYFHVTVPLREGTHIGT